MKHQSVFRPTHTRTEGRPPVWGSEFTTKVTPRGDSAEVAAELKMKIVLPPACVVPAFSLEQQFFYLHGCVVSYGADFHASFVFMCLIHKWSSELTGGPSLLSSLLPGPS